MNYFKNFKVVELASVLAGPSVGMFFAEMGAEVIKIENKKGDGDITRSWKLASEDKHHPFSAYYSSINYGKTSLFLDATLQSDYKKIEKLIASADLVIANFKSGDALKLKLDFDTIKKINPSIIYGEITGFSHSSRIAYDVVLQAETGFLSMTGTSDGTLCKLPVAFIDLLAAHQLKEGILVALLQQRIHQTALRVSISLFDAALASLANQATNYLMANQIAKPLGTIHPNIAPYGELFKTSDQKQIVLAVGSNSQFHQLLEVLQLPSIKFDQRFVTNTARVKHREQLAEILATKIILEKREQLVLQLIQANVPVGAVRSIDEVLNLDESQQHILSETKENHLLKAIKSVMFKIDQ